MREGGHVVLMLRLLMSLWLWEAAAPFTGAVDSDTSP